MNYSTDKPIKNESEDLLGRSNFSKQLAKTIYDYKENEGLVIGIFGKWGTGKTSIINMSIEEIGKLSEKDKNKPIILNFSPWNYSDKDNLIGLFFDSLKAKLNMKGNEEIKSLVGKLLNNYSDIITYVPITPSLKIYAHPIRSLFKAIGSKLLKEDNLYEIKEKLDIALIQSNRKIIVIIDDIDRLTNSQIRDVFQLVKQVGDFPNVIYLLAMDRDVVARALTEVHNVDGNEYLGKIIQVPFEIPEIRKSKLQYVFSEKLKSILSSVADDIELDNNYWNIIFSNCIEPYINTLRDVYRVVNIFQFKFPTLYKEISIEDLIAITTIEVLEPKLYKWIENNKNAVCEGLINKLPYDKRETTNYYPVYCDEFNKLGLNSERSVKCVSTLFPRFAQDVKKYNYGYKIESEIREKMRIAQEERLELCFKFDLNDIKISRSEINDFVYNHDKDMMVNVLNKINDEGNIIFFLDELDSLINKVPYNRLQLIASTLLDLHGKFYGEKLRSIFSISSYDLAEKLIMDIMKLLKTDQERFGIIEKVLKNTDISNLGSITLFINRIEIAYGRVRGNDSRVEDEQIISVVQLESIEKLFIERITIAASSMNILNINRFSYAFFMWKKIDKGSAEKFVRKMFEDDVNKLKFISSMSYKWTGTRGNGWDFNRDMYSDYINDDEIYNLIQSFDKSRLGEFDEIEQLKLASFVLNYKTPSINHATEEEARKLLSDWKPGIK